MPHSPMKYKAGYKYQLPEDYTIQLPFAPEELIITTWIIFARDGRLSLLMGYAWDGASGPTIDTEESIVASGVHDALYQLMRLGHLPVDPWRPRADKVFHDILLESGMLPPRAEVWYDMVRAFAAGATHAHAERPVLVAP